MIVEIRKTGTKMKTRKLYDIDAYATEFKAMVLSCEECGQTGSDEQQLYTVVLDQTLFFPEEGGQTPDKGILGDAEVVDIIACKNRL